MRCWYRCWHCRKSDRLLEYRKQKKEIRIMELNNIFQKTYILEGWTNTQKKKYHIFFYEFLLCVDIQCAMVKQVCLAFKRIIWIMVQNAFSLFLPIKLRLFLKMLFNLGLIRTDTNSKNSQMNHDIKILCEYAKNQFPKKELQFKDRNIDMVIVAGYQGRNWWTCGKKNLLSHRIIILLGYLKPTEGVWKTFRFIFISNYCYYNLR